MSSTNRNSVRHEADYYVTPVDSIIDFLDAPGSPSLNYSGDTVLDPCAGGDAKHPMSYPEALRRYYGDFDIDTVDIRADSRAAIKADYLTWTPQKQYNIIITNPPFNLALEIIQKALCDVADKGLVIMLLRLNFFGSQKRSAWLKNNMPSWCYVHSKRMSFSDCGGTDSIEYMHAVWVRGICPPSTQLRII